MEFKAYHKIRQFKDVIRDIRYLSDYKGEVDGNPNMVESEKPTLNFKGTVKLHGTNAGICYTPSVGIVAQKRSSLLDPESLTDHMGFNQFVQVNRQKELNSMMDWLWLEHCTANEQITLYGEWAGKGIQKSVSISELDKAFYYFDCKVYNPDTKEEHWIDISSYYFNIESVYNIHSFKTFNVEIDFNKPGLIQNTLIEYTNSVEQVCPVAEHFGKIGTGEGIVWTCYWKEEKHIMKVKGEKHSSSKVKKLANVDPELITSIHNFVSYACSDNRIEQGIKEVNATEKKDMPTLLRWVANDIITEESDTLEANSLKWKNVARECSNRVRQYYFSKLDKV